MARDAARDPRLGRFIRYWLPAVVYLVVIFTLSAQPRLRPPLDFQNADKVYHVLEYFGLGVILVRAVRGDTALKHPLAAGLLALILGMTIGISDELFQATVPGREMSALDFLADTLGLALAQIVYLAVVRD